MSVTTANPGAGGRALAPISKGKVSRPGLAALFAEWRKFSLSLANEGLSERELRIQYANRLLKRADHGKQPVHSWRELSEGEARRLRKIMARQSGSATAYLAQLAGRLAVELWGAYWDLRLTERVGERFHVWPAPGPSPAHAALNGNACGVLGELEPRDLHALIEELLSRQARKTGQEIEVLRQKLLRGRAEATGF